MKLEFLDQLREVTASLRAGATPDQEELRALKGENRRRAEAAEGEDREWCDSLPTWLNTTNSTVCNLKCGFCPQAYGKGVDWKMEDPIYQKVVEELYPAAETVQLSAYGEPMMTPHIQEKMEDMERFGVKLELITNATLMKGDALVARMARIMQLLTVSIDGGTAETYNALRIGADFDEVLGNIRRYNHFRRELPKEQRAPLHFNYILMKRTLEELPGFLRLAKELDAEHVTASHLVLLEESFRGEMLDAGPDWKRRTNEVLARSREVAEELGLSANLPPLYQLEEAEGEAAAAGEAAPAAEPMRCWFLWQRMYVGPFGDVIPCCLSGIHANSNVKESDFVTEWNSDLYREMRRRVHSEDPYGPCKDCYLINRSSEIGSFDRV
jgi:MoaA/NifB/PqqE/SkfB family radical SAM enzyme